MALAAIIEGFEKFKNGGARFGASPRLHLVNEFELEAREEPAATALSS
jgi:hypothetical protein